MRIATWNVERLKHKNELERITECCIRESADILVLTETDRVALSVLFSNVSGKRNLS